MPLMTRVGESRVLRSSNKHLISVELSHLINLKQTVQKQTFQWGVIHELCGVSFTNFAAYLVSCKLEARGENIWALSVCLILHTYLILTTLQGVVTHIVQLRKWFNLPKILKVVSDRAKFST